MIRTVAIVGMGALGLLYADQITKGLQDENAVCFLMDRERLMRHASNRYFINGEEKHFCVVDAAEAAPVDLLIVAVKYKDLPSALDTMKNAVGENTVILSVMNGVTSEEIIKSRYTDGRVLLCVAQGMDAMRDKTSLTYTQCGAIRIGCEDPAQNGILAETEEFLARAKVPFVHEADIRYRLWFKYMLNVGFNQTCAVFDVGYGIACTPGTEAHEVMVGAMREVIAVANAKNIPLTEADLQSCIAIERTLDPEGVPSMAQDARAKRPTEVDMFAGEMIKMAEPLGIPVPCNRFFHDRMKQIEREWK